MKQSTQELWNEYWKVMDQDLTQVGQLVEILKSCRERGSFVWIIGNGGSANIAEHWAEDLLQLAQVRAISLTNIGTITALANDYHYNEVFSRQLDIYARPKDVVVYLTTSGTSTNIYTAALRDRGTINVSITGPNSRSKFDVGEKMDLAIRCQSNVCPVVQEFQSMVLHLCVEELKR